MVIHVNGDGVSLFCCFIAKRQLFLHVWPAICQVGLLSIERFAVRNTRARNQLVWIQPIQIYLLRFYIPLKNKWHKRFKTIDWQHRVLRTFPHLYRSFFVGHILPISICRSMTIFLLEIAPWEEIFIAEENFDFVSSYLDPSRKSCVYGASFISGNMNRDLDVGLGKPMSAKLNFRTQLTVVNLWVKILIYNKKGKIFYPAKAIKAAPYWKQISTPIT